MIIVGAGQAGLLCASRLAQYSPTVIEQQKSLPNNHSALLRFRSNKIATMTGIEFKKVNVYKGVLCEDGHTITNNPTIRDFNAYSYKTTRRIVERSIINIQNAIRYVAPYGFIYRLASGTNIEYGRTLQSFIEDTTRNEAIISTIPMPILMEILDYPDKPQFSYIPIWTVNSILVDTDVYQTLYIPYGEYMPYRISITGSRMTMEFSREPRELPEQLLLRYLDTLGIQTMAEGIDIKKQDYGKIVPIDENERQKFILWATDNFNIYSLGRYATWRQILLDDVLEDIAIINKMIMQISGYGRRLHATKGE